MESNDEDKSVVEIILNSRTEGLTSSSSILKNSEKMESEDEYESVVERILNIRTERRTSSKFVPATQTLI